MEHNFKSIAEHGKCVFNQNHRIIHLGKLGQVEEAVTIFQTMPHKNLLTYNFMVSILAKNGRISDARKLFDKMPHRNLVSWNTMIAEYVHNNMVEEAAHLFDTMPRRDNFSWALMITCYSRKGMLRKARELFDFVPDKLDTACWNTMIAGYAKKGHFHEAEEVFERTPVKDLVSYNSMLARVYPEWFEEAFNVVRGMKVKADAGLLWDSLLAACRVHKNLELGRVAAEMLLELEPANASNYVTLSNMFAEAGRWKEVERPRVLMREKQAMKLPGCSLIEIQNQIQSFISDDPSKSRAENIQFILNTLTEHIRDKCISVYLI
ncbi:hypothetical protein AHAS_Ahas04G0263400 [Arachis hypogaea]|uniref:Pentatricopeptide repeat-containing protein n=1 Tax=Arachis hypogaea TaxID=3818 RepID=A0A445DB05_ARAHY|nr:hypothetical protein Ahy_A04g017416 [Arachis hypogaea]